jgi:hypothetical protein
VEVWGGLGQAVEGIDFGGELVFVWDRRGDRKEGMCTFCAGFEESFRLCQAETARGARHEDDFAREREFGEGCC